MSILKFIIYFLSNIFVSYSIFYIYKKINNVTFHIKSKKTISLLLIMSLLSTINNLYMIPTLKVFIIYLIIIIICKLQFKDNIKTIAFSALIITLASIFLEIILSIIFGTFVKNINDLNNNIFIKVLFSVIHTITLISITKFIKIHKIIEKTKFIISNYLNFFTGSLLVMLILNIIVYFRAEDFNNIGILVILLISILIFLILIRILIIDKYNNKILYEKNQNLQKTYETQAKISEEYRNLKHNLNGDLYALQTSLPLDKQEVIKQLLKKYNKNKKYELIENYTYVPDGIQGLFFIKQKEADLHKTNMYIRCNKKINIKINDYLNLCNVLNILLDNAIEASRQTEQKIIEVDIFEKNNKLQLTVLNTFNNTLNIDKLGRKNYSTKEIKSGIGLNYIKNLKSKNIKISFKIIGNLFISNIIYSE